MCIYVLGGKAVRNLRKWRWLVCGHLLLVSFQVVAQSLPAGISPAMIDQIKGMSAAQQQALARQYGINIPGTSGASEDPGLARQGVELTSPPQASLPTSMSPEQNETSTEVTQKARIRYGRALFNREVSTFAPTDDAPVPGSYRLGVGDEIIVQLFGKENLAFTLQIDRVGDVTFPKLGVITLSGLTFEDARDLLSSKVTKELIGVESAITMGRLRAINIFMAGEVSVPGAYSVSAMTTVTQALFQAGGVTDIGSLRNILVRRGGEVVTTFDTYDLLMRGDTANDIRLQSGDVIFVPPYKGVIDLEGELKRPMVYELEEGQTIGDVLEMAGSFTDDAFPSSSILTRRSVESGLPLARTINLTTKDALAMIAKSGDLLRVPRKADSVANSVTLKGAVPRPGIYGWVPGMRVSNVIQDARRDLRRDADLTMGMIVRLKNDLLDIEVMQFDLAAALAKPGSEDDMLLEEFDEILIFALAKDSSSDARVQTGRQDMLQPVLAKLLGQAKQGEPVQVVSISGAVRAPGSYPITVGATVHDLLLAAGGLSDFAFMGSAELRRMKPEMLGEVKAEYLELGLGRGSRGLEERLKSRDHLTVRTIPNWSPLKSIVISGQVKFPGEYRIREGELLSEVLQRAGGVTLDAQVNAAVFTRVSVADNESKQISDFAEEIRTSYATRFLTEESPSMAVSDMTAIIDSLKLVQPSGRQVIDLTAIIDGDSAADVAVLDGDRLVVPERVNIVNVVGEVRHAGAHTYRSELSLNDYIELSAGYTKRANRSGIYVIKANGAVVNIDKNLWVFEGPVDQILPGDTIVVPLNVQYRDSLASWREITQIVYQSIVSVAAVARL